MCSVGIPVLLVSFIIWGICSIPDGDYEEYSDLEDEKEDATDGDVSTNEDDDEPEALTGLYF